MKYLSLFSGIEAATCAWHPLGWEPVAFAEVDPYCRAVLGHHYPGVTIHEDVTAAPWREYEGQASLLVGGSPCQSFSVAGLRKGLADPRGHLTLEYLAAVDRVRPDWVVWENVPGILSHDRGRTFGTFLGALGQLGYGWAYRVLNAKYFGVAQQRRRVFVVACAGGWQRAAAVLFEPESLSGDPEPRRETGEAAAAGAPPGIEGGGDGCGGLIPQFANTLTARMHKGVNTTADEGQTMIVHAQPVADPITAHEQRTYTHEGSTFRCRNVVASDAMIARPSYAVRRLTPRECERLQGFPDDYTLIDYNGKPAADSRRYKALGNSMAVPVMRWIGHRIEQVHQIKGAMERTA